VIHVGAYDPSCLLATCNFLGGLFEPLDFFLRVVTRKSKFFFMKETFWFAFWVRNCSGLILNYVRTYNINKYRHIEPDVSFVQFLSRFVCVCCIFLEYFNTVAVSLVVYQITCFSTVGDRNRLISVS